MKNDKQSESMDALLERKIEHYVKTAFANIALRMLDEPAEDVDNGADNGNRRTGQGRVTDPAQDKRLKENRDQ